MISHKKEIDKILIIIVLIILSTINDSSAQTINSMLIMNASINTNAKSITINEDYNKDGIEEQFSAEIIQEISKNAYWVKKAVIKNPNNIILMLGKRIEYYGKEVIKQIDANYGYIIEFVINDQNWKSLSIWLADEKGKKISDCISLDFQQNFSLLF